MKHLRRYIRQILTEVYAKDLDPKIVKKLRRQQMLSADEIKKLEDMDASDLSNRIQAAELEDLLGVTPTGIEIKYGDLPEFDELTDRMKWQKIRSAELPLTKRVARDAVKYLKAGEIIQDNGKPYSLGRTPEGMVVHEPKFEWLDFGRSGWAKHHAHRSYYYAEIIIEYPKHQVKTYPPSQSKKTMLKVRLEINPRYDIVNGTVMINRSANATNGIRYEWELIDEASGKGMGGGEFPIYQIKRIVDRLREHQERS